jgi:hypothetical protein
MSDVSDGVPTQTSASEKETDSIETQLDDTKTWLELKRIVSAVVVTMSDDHADKARYLSFIATHWGCHAPRQIEIAMLQGKLRKAEELLAIPAVASPRVKKRRCEYCGRMTRISTAGCDHCDVEDK